jgi:hypothetical protein
VAGLPTEAGHRSTAQGVIRSGTAGS